MQRKTSRLSGLMVAMGAVALMLSHSASAAPISDWDYSVSNSFTDVEFSNGATAGSTYRNSVELSWGATGGSHVGPGADRSAFILSGDMDGTVATGAQGSLLTLTHYDNPLDESYAELVYANINTTVDLTPTGGGDTVSLSFTLEDLLNLNGLTATESFEYDGTLYEVNMLEMATEMGALMMAGDFGGGGEDTVMGFSVMATGPAPNNPVPEPGGLALLGLGLAALGLMRRRRDA